MSSAQSTTAPPHESPIESSNKSNFESWGRYPEYSAELKPLHWQGDFPAVLEGVHTGALAVGLGRSYGDVCQLKGGTLLPTTSMNRLLGFDATTGVPVAMASSGGSPKPSYSDGKTNSAALS